MKRMVAFNLSVILAILTALCSTARPQTPAPIHVGVVPSTSSGGLYIAKEKGYFSELGLDVVIDDVRSASQMQGMLATNRMQVLGGAISAGMINGVAAGVPIKAYYAIALSPSFHNLLIRPDLKDVIKTPADLKGRSIALNGRGTIDDYETNELLASAGLSFQDVEIKLVPLASMSAALQNKAVDAAMMFPPLSTLTANSGLGIKWIEPEQYLRVSPLLIAVGQFNTDWVAKNESTAKKYLQAVLRGTREYCEAFHFGANRPDVVKILAKYTRVHDPALLDAMEWGSSDPAGEIPTDSLMDFQKFHLNQRQIEKVVPIERLVERDWIREAARKLGPFKLEHDDGKAGCR
jgi:NitT/TauT family transport system substrate-binding protein